MHFQMIMMLRHVALVLALSSLGPGHCIRHLMVTNQTQPELVMAGRRVRLSCSIMRPWFFCLWDTPGPESDMECAIQYSQPERICSQSNKTKLIAQTNSCDVQFVVIINFTHLWQTFMVPLKIAQTSVYFLVPVLRSLCVPPLYLSIKH